MSNRNTTDQQIIKPLIHSGRYVANKSLESWQINWLSSQLEQTNLLLCEIRDILLKKENQNV